MTASDHRPVLPGNLFVARKGNLAYLHGDSDNPIYPLRTIKMVIAVITFVFIAIYCLYQCILYYQGQTLVPISFVAVLAVLAILISVFLGYRMYLQLQVRNRLQNEGEIILGKITDAGIEMRRTRGTGIINLSGSYYIVVADYQFRGPHGGLQHGTLYSDQTDLEEAPPAGTPVAILYCDNELFMPL